LSRELILRNFHKQQLDIESSTGSDLNKIIGLGQKKNPKTDKLEKVTDLYPSHLKEVLAVFEYYPVFENFGITFKDAMMLPINEWVAIRKSVEKIGLKDRYKPKEVSEESQMLLKIIEQLIGGKGEGG